MKKILNLSNHVLTEEQKKELTEKGYEVVELDKEEKEVWGQLNPDNYINVCECIISKYYDQGVRSLHVAGFPAAVSYITKVFSIMECLYAYSERKSVEKTNEKGEVVKTNVFVHKGFYPYA